jgi:predicted transposase YdaD
MPDDERRFDTSHLAAVLLVLGAILIAVSFLPLSSLSKRTWTMEDSRHYGDITRELHSSGYQSAAEAGRTEEEMERYRENLQQEFTKLKTQLEQAQNEPHRWSQILLWTGATLAAVGGLLHVVKGGD